MRRRDEDSRWSPCSEQLAAFADGELERCAQGEALRERIETWLADHPDAAADVDSLEALSALFKKTAPADPGEAAWHTARNRAERPPAVQREASPAVLRKLRWSAAFALVAAASIVLALVLAPPGGEKPNEEADVVPLTVAGDKDVEYLDLDEFDGDTVIVGRLPSLPMATSEEVEILRVKGADTEVLVVGELPVRGAVVLAKAGEVTMMSMDPALDNMKPEARVNGPDAPMIWAPSGADAVK